MVKQTQIFRRILEENWQLASEDRSSYCGVRTISSKDFMCGAAGVVACSSEFKRVISACREVE